MYYLRSMHCQSFLLFELPLEQEQVEEQGLLLPLQLQDHCIGLPHFLLFSLQGYGERLVIQLDPLQDGVGGVSH